MKKPSTILIYSGGLDSTILLYDLVKSGFNVKALSVDYGQRHKKELQHAKTLCKKLDVKHHIADISAINPLLAGSSLTSANIKVAEGHYKDESMKSTVVPNRNMIFLSIAIAWAISTGADSVSFAAHKGDHAIYKDCRVNFLKAMNRAMQTSGADSVSLYTPFSLLTKTTIVKLGNLLDVPFKQTWSCYNGGKNHCGRCGTCVERKEAFKLAGVTDPTIYDNV
jgi:7-cyano-7-deazaguanine synthase